MPPKGVGFPDPLSRTLKDDIQPLDSGFLTLLKLKPVSFKWNSGALKDQPDIGFIAQDVQEVVPGIVHSAETAGAAPLSGSVRTSRPSAVFRPRIAAFQHEGRTEPHH
jgi:hypothetical protein